MKRMSGAVFSVLAAGLLISAAHAAAPETKDVKRATDRCGNWIVEQFNLGSKSFGKGKDAKDPAVLALVVLSLLDSPRDYKESNGPFISEPIKYLVSKVKKDGSIKSESDDPQDAYFYTISALKATHNDAHKEVIERLEAHYKTEFPHGMPVPSYTKIEHLQVNSLNPGLLRSTLIALKHLGETKELSIDGQNVKWGAVVAEGLLKLQQANGSFGEDVSINAMALEILNKCYKAMK
jgi:hypothetical protein